MTHGGHNDDRPGECGEYTAASAISRDELYVYTLTRDIPAPDHLIAHNLAISMLDAGQGKDTRGAHMQML